jgi:hypothetical protein
MTNFIIFAENSEKGISIVGTENGALFAYSNGKRYYTHNYRPVDGNGRQLREDSQKAISELLPKAIKARDEYIDKMNSERERYREAGRSDSAPPKKSFAEVLEESFVNTLTEKASIGMVDTIYPVVEKMLVDRFGLLPVVHEIRIPDRPKTETTEILHKDFDKILSMVMDNESVYLCGPAGTGKSYLAKQIATTLNLDYYYTNSVTDEVQIKGFVDANGRYHETQFYQAFTQGGVFLLDELDGSIPETLVMLNNALANGYFAFPNGKAEAHPDFHCIAAGNTFGTGADNEYTGRYQLDASSMDRFALITVDYDKRIELSMANGDESLVEFANEFRKAVKACGASCLCTYRAIKRLTKFSAYMDKTEAIRIALTKGLPADDCRMIYNRMSHIESNEWVKAFRNVSKA